MARARSTASPVLRFDRFGVNQLSVKAVPRRRRTAMKASWGNFEKSTPTGPPGVEPIGAKPRSLPRRSFASLASTASSIGLSLPAAGEIHAAPRPAAREREPILQRGPVRPREEPKNSLLDLEEDMYEAEIPEERTRLAQAVLRLDPEHIEAHMGLAEHAATRAEGIALLREAVRIGKRTWALAIEASAKSTGGATSAPDSSCGRSWPMAMPWRGQAALSWRPAATGRS